MSLETPKAKMTEEEVARLAAEPGYSQFVSTLAAKPASFNLSPDLIRLLVDGLRSLNAASLELDHFKRVLTYGDKLRMNPLPAYRDGIASQAELLANGDLIHALLGKITEALELAPVLFNLLTGVPVDKVNLSEELGDDEFYTQLARMVLGVDSVGIRRVNVRKLEERYNGLVFSQEAALNRDLDAEHAALSKAVN